ncbi:TonB-dependent receptor [Maribacter aestuarii]|uniref:TonB-dependent receptor n=1 Tax=Maribacter aestuarii TaxID=1130723 RepID=UPI00248D2339|nr:carboxypeptidase-like regulatory domain-containing protein [Maribacter aestuarii]
MKFCATIILYLLLCHITCSAQTATITGVVLDENRNPLPSVNVTSENTGTSTDDNGFYLLQIFADKETSIIFSHLGHEDVRLEKLILTTNETFEFNPILKTNVTQIDEVTVSATGDKKVTGILSISTEDVRKIPGANAGVENILKLLPGVSSNNELSTQYSVRGGNYDENLVYINEIEVYRPFLIRSAQQEGLSFVNSDMVQDVKFSAGGFQAKYGDKLSSVLDITYKNPSQFSAQGDISLLGLSTSLETISKNKKFSSVSGLRYRSNSMLVNSQQTQSNFNPAFTDVQSYFTYRFSEKFDLNFLGNFSVNNYKNEPIERQTNFGTIDDPRSLTVFYEGRERNKYTTTFGALKGNYYVNDKTTLKFISSLYHTVEEEFSDVFAFYELGDINDDSNNLNPETGNDNRGIGSQFNRSRNNLDALIFNLNHRGHHKRDGFLLEWGIKYTHEDIRDQLRESEFIDSAGFSIRPPREEFMNNQPEEPFETPLVPYTGIDATNFVKTNRFSGFLQMGRRTQWKSNDLYYNLGLRLHHWTVSGTNVEKVSQTIISPRAQFAIKPDWDKDMLFRFSAGIYQQPPFYRELRDSVGSINPNVKAQKSFHVVLGNEYSFNLWERPFTLNSEVYYKKLTNINPYTLDDVRIRYAANNSTEAYVYGAEMRLYGAFVPGTESWMSIGFLRTEENINNRGYIPRPTDQRFKLGILFQDYIPSIPDIKMHMNLVYMTGVPGGSPSYANPYEFQNRLRDYKRADLGISYIFVGKDKTFSEEHWLHQFKNLSLGLEIFNLFNNQNSITNTWVRDVDSKNEFAVPNFLTSRIFNVRLQVRL